jgi:hypothetical protein
MPYQPTMVRVEGPGGITVIKKVMAQTEPSKRILQFQIGFEMRFHGQDVPFHQELVREESSLIRIVVDRLLGRFTRRREPHYGVLRAGYMDDLLERARGANMRDVLGRLYSIPDWFGGKACWPWSVNQGLYSNKFSSIIREAPTPGGYPRSMHFIQSYG